MTTIKCKMCGGDLVITPGSTICECEYCGSKQTIPNTDDEKRLKLYERANKLRFNCEFDKAAGVYESIVSEFQDEAEAYWGLVLCKYGIEYVDDPKTGKKIPTCHRSSFDSVMDDGNFELVMENADAISRGIYREEAKQIEELRKDIIEVSSKEEPYDIFICYKETADDGQRSIDSVIAQDVYDALTEEGYKVFFSRITLEDKLGQEYEPYIFAALNSAKVMLAFGTQYDYYNAVWVKNEWSRFLQLMESGQKKTLIPCYKNIDAYDMPKEFAKLQAQDMGKVGAIQDLIRGIKKIVPLVAGKTAVSMGMPSNAVNSENTAPLLKRAFIFLEAGKYKDADDYCERVLDQDPENAWAYLGKLMADMHVKRQEELSGCDEPFDGNDNYQNAIRFGDDDLRIALNGYIELINARKKDKQLSDLYDEATDLMKKAGISAPGEELYKSAAERFGRLSGYKDADNLAGVCLNLAEESRKNDIYNSAVKMQEEDRIESVESAIASFKLIPGWKDTEEHIRTCESKIVELREKAEQERIEKERKEREARRRAKKRNAIIVCASIVVIILIGVFVYLNKFYFPEIKYNDALKVLEDGDFEDAFAKFESLNGYNDSKEMAAKCKDAIIVLNELNSIKNGTNLTDIYHRVVSLETMVSENIIKRDDNMQFIKNINGRWKWRDEEYIVSDGDIKKQRDDSINEYVIIYYDDGLRMVVTTKLDRARQSGKRIMLDKNKEGVLCLMIDETAYNYCGDNEENVEEQFNVDTLMHMFESGDKDVNSDEFKTICFQLAKELIKEKKTSDLQGLREEISSINSSEKIIEMIDLLCEVEGLQDGDNATVLYQKVQTIEDDEVRQLFWSDSSIGVLHSMEGHYTGEISASLEHNNHRLDKEGITVNVDIYEGKISFETNVSDSGESERVTSDIYVSGNEFKYHNGNKEEELSLVNEGAIWVNGYIYRLDPGTN